MSDEALRGSERAWRGSHDAEALARALQARVRTGALPPEAGGLVERLASGAVTPDDVSLAGLLGHPWLEGLVPPLPAGPVEWFVALASFGREPFGAALLAALARVRAVVDGLTSGFEEQPGDFGTFFVEMHARDRAFALGDLDAVKDAVEGWLASTDASAGSAPALAVQLAIDRGLARYRGHGFDVAVRSAAHAAAVLLAGEETRREALATWIDEVIGLVPADELRAAIRDALAPGLLGLPTDR